LTAVLNVMPHLFNVLGPLCQFYRFYGVLSCLYGSTRLWNALVTWLSKLAIEEKLKALSAST